MMKIISLAAVFQRPLVSRDSSRPVGQIAGVDPTHRAGGSPRSYPRPCAAAAILLASALGCVRPASGQIDIVLKLDGIKGESRVDKHEEEIDVISISMGASQTGTFHTGGGGGSGKVNFQDISIAKLVDKASPELLLATANGNHIAKARIDFIATGDKPKTFYSIELEKVLVTSVTTSVRQTDNRLSEGVTLNFAKIKISYQECDKSGSPKGAPITFGWDVEQNVKQ